MMKAGHSETYRLRVTDRAIGKYSKMLENETQGVRKLYRNKHEILEERKVKKYNKTKAGWFRALGYNAILRVESTPGGKLTKTIRKSIEEDP